MIPNLCLSSAASKHAKRAKHCSCSRHPSASLRWVIIEMSAARREKALGGKVGEDELENQKAIFNATIRMEKDQRKKLRWGYSWLSGSWSWMLMNNKTDIGGWNQRQLDADVDEDHDQHCNRGEESQPGQDREWRERESWGVDRCGWSCLDQRQVIQLRQIHRWASVVDTSAFKEGNQSPSHKKCYKCVFFLIKYETKMIGLTIWVSDPSTLTWTILQLTMTPTAWLREDRRERQRSSWVSIERTLHLNWTLGQPVSSLRKYDR